MTSRVSLLVACGLSASVCAQRLELHADAPAGLLFGQPFALEARLDWREGWPAPAALPAVAFAPLAVELLGSERSELGDGAYRLVLRYRARALASGELRLGPLDALDAQGALRARSQPLVLTVRSTLPEPAGELEWPGDVRAPATAWSWWWLAVPCVLLGLGSRRWRKVAAPVAVVPVSDDPLAELDAIAWPASSDDPVPFHVAVKALLRRVAGQRHRVRAEVATSEELLAALPPSASLRACLSACDAVLFGASRPDAPTLAATVAAARAWLAAATGGTA